MRQGVRFTDAAFAAVHIDIELLQLMLSTCENSSPTGEEPIKHHCQQCEASLQFLQTLCQHGLFRDHIVKHQVGSLITLHVLDNRSISAPCKA